jgi:hypothetical protein
MKHSATSSCYAVLSILLIVDSRVVAFSPIATPTINHASFSLFAQSPAKRIIPTKSKLTPAQRLRIANAEATDGGAYSSNLDQVKSMFYSFSDGISSLVPNSKNTNPNAIVNGYSNNKKQQETKSTSRQNFAPWMPNVAVPETPPADTSPFDTFKSTIYSTIDWVATPKEKSNPSTSPNVPIPRRSSKSSATTTNSKTPVSLYDDFKESVYSTQDRLTQLIQSDLPSTLRSAQQRATDVKEGLVSLPNRLSTTAQTMSQLPQKVEGQIFTVQGAMLERQQQLQAAQERVQNLPQSAEKILSQAQDALLDRQQSLLNVYTSLRVLLGVEAPTPQPPSTKPPSQQPPATVALSVLVGLLQTLLAFAGQFLAWLVPKIQTAIEENLTKVQEAAVQKEALDATTTTSFLDALGLAKALDERMASSSILDTTDLDREIAAALALAEEALAQAAPTTDEVTPVEDIVALDFEEDISSDGDREIAAADETGEGKEGGAFE